MLAVVRLALRPRRWYSSIITYPEGDKLALHKKIAEISAAISHVEKKGRNDFHKYDYAQAADVYAAVRDEFSARGVTVVPAITSCDIRENGKNKMVSVAMEITLTDSESGEQMVVPWHGVGEDAGDKAIYKALTGSLKYFYIQLLSLPTGDDPEDDAQDRRRSRSAAPASTPSKPDVVELANQRSAELTKLGRSLKMADADIKEVLGDIGIGSRLDLVNPKNPDDPKRFNEAMAAIRDAASGK